MELTEACDHDLLNAVPPVVVRNDEWTWKDVFNRVYKDRAFDNIVISPGPGSPACPGDIGELTSSSVKPGCAKEAVYFF